MKKSCYLPDQPSSLPERIAPRSWLLAVPSPALTPYIIVVLVLCFLSLTSWGVVIQKGKSCVPGHPGKIVEYSVMFKKVPANGVNQIQVWIDATLTNPQAGDDLKFVLCAMLNLNKPKVNSPTYTVTVSSGIWTCKANGGSTSWHPNYHFGCRRVQLNAGNGWHQYVVDDVTASFSTQFTESDIATAYIDVAVDCPNGFLGCGAVVNQMDRFMTPGDGLFPNTAQNCMNLNNGTSSWWIMNDNVTKCPDPRFPFTHVAETFIPIGNWYTMAHPEQVFPSELIGGVTNAPIGAEVLIEFPASTGAGPYRGVVDDRGVLTFSIPYTISPGLMNEADEHMRLQISYDSRNPLPDPGAAIRFEASSRASARSVFPDGTTLYASGDWMHGILVQYPVEYEAPFIFEQALRKIDEQTFELFVEAGDQDTSVVSAAVAYRVNGRLQPYVAIPWDATPMSGTHSRFRLTIGPLPAASVIDGYEIHIVDEAGNVATNTFGQFVRLEASLSTPRQLRLTWPTNAAGYELNCTANLVDGPWSLVAVAPTVDGENNVVALEITQSPRFYRLTR